ncbi:hypothetical protein BO82DRAFT_407885 [Aspergillus uvarum CBS 121591]|uniref:Uncharacterized protein n=1 Tax=Aspergillus uvarum CBS 121591 TaxID=1448315 RepID=A0A319BSV6_9EURO|nr:hypothetical protein BO82DRAFT_407885 [Aspergillus uvarum CBS 121591]PYH75624.1 hypothetical protein BO82DRAFT_407885 [Aspergillus uvarum CBS 121591]
MACLAEADADNRELCIVMPHGKPLAGIACFLLRHDRYEAHVLLSSLRGLAFMAESPAQERLCCHRIPGSSQLSGHDMLFPKSFIQGVTLLLNRLSAGHLMNFTWSYSWLPKGILDLEGYIPQSQPQLSSLALYTRGANDRVDGGCIISKDINVDGLVKLRHLRTLLAWHLDHDSTAMMERELDLIREIGWHRGRNRLYRAHYRLFKELQEMIRTGINDLLTLYCGEMAALGGIQGLLDLYCSQSFLPFQETIELLCLFYLDPRLDVEKCESILNCGSQPLPSRNQLLALLRLHCSQPLPTTGDVPELLKRLASPDPALALVERTLVRYCSERVPSLSDAVKLLNLFYSQPGLSLSQAEEHLSRFSSQPSPPLKSIIESLTQFKSQQQFVSVADVAVGMQQRTDALAGRAREAEDAWKELLQNTQYHQ